MFELYPTLLLCSLTFSWLDDFRVYQGKIIDVDLEDRIVTILPEADLIHHLPFDTSTLVYDDKGKMKNHLINSRFNRGAVVRIILSNKSNNITELRGLPQPAEVKKSPP